MNRKIALIAFVGAASAAQFANAQTLTSFTLNDGLFRYSESGITGTTVRTGTGGGTGNFGLAGTLTGSAVVTASDQMFQNWWWYRGQNDTREFALSNQTQGLQINANTVALRYVENTNIQFDFVYTLNQITATSAAVTINWSVTNLSSAGSQSVSLFNMTDYDAGGGFSNQAVNTFDPAYWSLRANQSTAISTTFATLAADIRLPDAWQVGQFGTGVNSPRALLTNTAVNSLNNTSAGMPGDWTGAFQWNVVELAPGATVGGRLTKGYNFEIPTPGAMALLGLGGLIAARRRRA